MSDLLAGLKSVVQYRGKREDIAPIKWTTMAGFDSASLAHDYAAKCAQDNEHWEYRSVDVPENE